MLRDFRFALRYLAKNRGTTALAVLSLALGMMATTSIYSVVRAVILDPFPYKDVDDLMSVRVYTPGQQFGRTGYSTDQFLDISERSTIFTGVIASTISDVLWTDASEPQRLRGNYGTPNTFEVMGVPPLVGRAFGPADAAPGAPPVAVLGYRFWQRQFGGDSSVVGKSFRLNGQARTVVGVMPKRFMWRGADVYLPIVLRRGEVVEGVRNVHLLGRLKPNITAAHAESDLRPIMEDLARREPAQFPQNWRVGLLSFEETFPSSIRQNLWIMFGAVGLLLLIACANVSNLLLSKATERQREMTIRAALGSGRGNTIRQLLVESLLIACAAGVLGTALAAAGLQAILALVPPATIPDESEVALNLPVLLFTFLVAATTSVVFGLAPALHATSRDIASSLREVGRSVTGGRLHVILRQSLVVIEVALSLMLLVAAGLMIRTVLAVNTFDLGFRSDRVLTFRVPLPEARYPQREQRLAFFNDLLERVARVPGVERVGLNNTTHPIGYLGGMFTAVEVAGAGVPSANAVVHHANAGYQEVLGLPLIEGRFFSASDVDRVLPVAVVNQTFVRTRMDGRSAIGRTIRIPRLKQPPLNTATDTFEIVGIVKDTVNVGIDEDIMPEAFVPYTHVGRSDRIVVLARGDAGSITKAVVSHVYAIDPQQPAMDVRSMENLLQDYAYAGPRFNLVLFSLFGGLGLLLAVVGVYGVMSTTVAQQVHEMGVRLAIGASPASIFLMTLGRGARLLGAGIILGLVGAVFAARLLAGYVWQATTFDLLTFAAVSAVLLLAGMQACALPARRASKISPITALRQK
jgi:putative ABC transport system permease protein